jgi:4-diphosphocytidyl-2-C-methyl-D-erythritol kinase
MASGIGEELQPVTLGERHYVVVFPGISIATEDVFDDPGLKRDSAPAGLQEALAGQARNDCEAVVRSRFPEMDRAFERLRRWGRPVLTGTGSGIFIRMQGREEAISAAREIKSLYNGRAVRGVDRSPVLERLQAGGS